jgi:hypothetical protein
MQANREKELMPKTPAQNVIKNEIASFKATSAAARLSSTSNSVSTTKTLPNTSSNSKLFLHLKLIVLL